MIDGYLSKISYYLELEITINEMQKNELTILDLERLNKDLNSDKVSMQSYIDNLRSDLLN